jgi:hypothetical protein
VLKNLTGRTTHYVYFKGEQNNLEKVLKEVKISEEYAVPSLKSLSI